jgi:dihydroorotate dehydrogenase (fumarate)
MPDMEEYNTGPDEYLRHLEACKRELAIPVIGSLNGASEGGWIRYAKLIQDAGADALELNVYFIAADPDVSGTQVEQRYLELVLAVRESVTIPLAVKIGPYFSSMANMAGRFVKAGANGLVLFNRFLQPDIDLETLRVDPTLHLSTSDEMRLPLRWIAMLHGRVSCSLAATTGVHTAEDAVKLLLAGADVTMMASALFRHGPEHLSVVLEGMRTWLDEHEYASIEQLKGSVSQENVADPLAFSRSNYMQMLVNFTSPYDWREIPARCRPRRSISTRARSARVEPRLQAPAVQRTLVERAVGRTPANPPRSTRAEQRSSWRPYSSMQRFGCAGPG